MRGDRRVLRLIRKWLRAGVSEEGKWSKTVVGTAQGSVISPFLANVYLHYVLDLWVTHWRKHHAQGDVIVVRYADEISSWASNTGGWLSDAYRSLESDSGSLAWSCTRRRLA
jgi:retron-type reverse transcriptase